jgi:hypothetical protein
MANERLRTALLQGGVTPADLADTVGVDPKTIERWIGGRIPYRRHRHQVATCLGVSETYLWPGALAAEQVVSASETEIVAQTKRYSHPADISPDRGLLSRLQENPFVPQPRRKDVHHRHTLMPCRRLVWSTEPTAKPIRDQWRYSCLLAPR